jgi:DNA polymerase
VSIRDEAVLRELNLYPLWVRREAPSPQETIEVKDPSVQPAAIMEALIIQPPVESQISPSNLAEAEINKPALPRNYPEDADWPELKKQVHGCTACKLRSTCTQTVFGVGDEKAGWLFVGEGPGADEDAQGEPFVGQAGKLLDNMLAAIKLKRGRNVYIANVVKCRPPNNRAPEADEIARCLPYLQRQVALIQPKIIVALGKTAACALLGQDATLGSLRGKVHQYQGIPLIITYHPAYLLRSPAEKAKAWQDLCFAVSTHTA